MKPIALALLAAAAAWAGNPPGKWGGELRFCLHHEPRTLHPAAVDDSSAEIVRYLTGGVLLRVNRVTQAIEPELASSWKLENGGRTISFKLREGVSFSDGTPFTAEDVAYTMQVLLDPNLHSPTGDSLRPSAGAVSTESRGKYAIAVTFPEPLAGVARLFDQVALLSKTSPQKERAVLGPFSIAEHKAGAYLLLARNPNYWKVEGGRRLPYLDSIRLDIQPNRQIEFLRFTRGQIHLMSGIDADQFDELTAKGGGPARDLGPGLEGEMMWFNLTDAAPIPAYRKAWFRSRNFRVALSHAIRRADLCKVVYRGHAVPAAGPFSPANRFWFNQSIQPHPFDLAAARRLLAADGFRNDSRGVMTDRDGHPVEFSLVTNSSNRARERIAAMLQADLAALGMRLNVVSLDFPSLLERISKTFNYEACLLGLTNVDLDPNGQMNVWLSSAVDHQWNPRQKTPQTPWEAEIDALMRKQAATADDRRRKPLFDRVQAIVLEQAPFLYLAYKNALVAVSPSLRNLEPSVLNPQLFWNVDRLWLAN